MTKLAKSRDPVSEIILTETKVLSALARGTTEGSIRTFARTSFGSYRWRDPIHQVIFGALMMISPESEASIRDQLPSCLTRMGFPDLDGEGLFTMPRVSKAEAERLIERLMNNYEL
jgi:hypothetical protein